MSAGPRFTPLRAEFVDGLRAESAPESAACEHSHRAVCAQTCERNFARTRRRRGQFARKRRIEVLRAKNSVSCGVLHANRASTDGAQRRAPFGCARLFVLPGSAQLFALVSLHAAVRVRQLARRIKHARFARNRRYHALRACFAASRLRAELRCASPTPSAERSVSRQHRSANRLDQLTCSVS